MRTPDRENEVFHNALNAFKKNVDIPIEVEVKTLKKDYDQNLVVDKQLTIVVEDFELLFQVEIKTYVTKAVIAMVLHKLAQKKDNVLLVAKYINRTMAEDLKNNKIQFIDTAGNTYINTFPLYIFVIGNRPPDVLEKTGKTRAFAPNGLKMIYALLCNPRLEGETYRDIARVAGIALGAVGWIKRDLKELGFLVDMGKEGQKLINKKNLLERWVIAYQEKLRPKLFLGNFKGAQGWWQDIILNPYNAQWGGEVAAAKLTKYLKPKDLTIYTTKEHLNHLIINFRLKRDRDGDIEILERFWQYDGKMQNNDLVHPVLIYADLIGTREDRNVETAKLIYEQYIYQHIIED